MPEVIFGFLATLVSLGAAVLIVMLVMQASNRKAKDRHEAFLKLLESGVYDYQLVRPKRRGHAVLGWGIVFTAIGLGVLAGIASAEDPSALRNGMAGAMVPMFMGIGMIVFWVIVRKIGNGASENDEPIVLEKREGASPKPPVAVG